MPFLLLMSTPSFDRYESRIYSSIQALCVATPMYESTSKLISSHRFSIQCSVLINHLPLHVAPKLLDELPLPGTRALDSKILPMVDGNRPPTATLRILPGRIPIHDDAAAGLRQHHPAGTDIPGPAAALPVGVDGALGDGAEIQGRGPQRPRAVHHRTALVLARAEPRPRAALHGPVGPGAVGAPFDHDQGRRQARQRLQRLQWEPLLVLYRPRVAVDVGDETALAPHAAVQAPREGVVHDADGRDSVECEAQRDAHVRPAVHEVRGAVDRVDHEGRLRPQCHAWLVGFLAEEREGRVEA